MRSAEAIADSIPGIRSANHHDIVLAIRTAQREALEAAAKTCEAMVIGGRAWTEEQAIAGDALLSAAKSIREHKLGQLTTPRQSPAETPGPDRPQASSPATR